VGHCAAIAAAEISQDAIFDDWLRIRPRRAEPTWCAWEVKYSFECSQYRNDDQTVHEPSETGRLAASQIIPTHRQSRRTAT
jgi:hypothetical protein